MCMFERILRNLKLKTEVYAAMTNRKIVSCNEIFLIVEYGIYKTYDSFTEVLKRIAVYYE